MESLREIFRINRTIVFFIYGLSFFVMGLAIFLHSRRYSRLRLARDLYWLAAFGILHGVHEWGAVFIPIQAAYMPAPVIDFLQAVQVILLAVSFLCLMMFGAVALENRNPRLKYLVILLGVIWGIVFGASIYGFHPFSNERLLPNIGARYLLGLPAGLLAAYGLRYQARMSVTPLSIGYIDRALGFAQIALIVYAVLAGMIVPSAQFFPASILNYELVENVIGVPVQVLRSLIGFFLAIAIIRVLEIFEIEVDRMIEAMEIERIQTAERDRIGQEIHDGAVQAMYSASLILESMQQHIESDTEAALRLDRARRVLSGAITDLRQYMVSLKSGVPAESLGLSLKNLIADPRFSSLLQIQLEMDVEPDLKPIQVGHTLAIVQECFSNTLRHAHARHISVEVHRETNHIALVIRDDGHGFDEQKVMPGYGLRTIRDRARLLGAALNIQSRIGKGTVTTLLIPIGEAP